MTIHDTHPFADSTPDPARRLRGRLGGAVSLWTTGVGPARAGLTVTSLMLANGEPVRLMALIDPDSELAEAVADTGHVLVQLLSWRHRDLAEMFAGEAPAPGGVFRQAAYDDTAWGPRLSEATTWVGCSVESAVEVGWSTLLTVVVEDLAVGDDAQPLLHRRGRYATLDG